MGQVLHGSATTTEAVRRAIQHSQESLRALAKRYGVNPKTIAKWKARTSVSDLPTGPKAPRSTVLSVEEEAVVVAFRRHTLLPLDDCLYALQATIPHLTRSSLHRCLQRHGISRLPDVEDGRGIKRKFKAYSIGYFHIDIAEVRTAQGKLYLLVAIDRTSKFAFVEMHEKVARRTAGDFLRRLIAAVPYKVHTVLTDNGTHFTTPGNTSSAAPDIKAALEAGELVWAFAFEYACAQNDIDHRLTKPKHPWTTDVIDKCFFAGSELFSSRARATAWRSRARGASPAAQPSSSPLGCGARARLLWTTRIPTGDEARVRHLGLLDPPALLIAMALDIVSVSRASLAAFGFISRLQLQIAQLPGVQRRPGPHVAFTFAQQMPDEHRELAGRRDSGDMLTAAGADSQEERTQRTRRSRCRPGCLDEHASGMAAALLGDPAVISRSRT